MVQVYQRQTHESMQSVHHISISVSPTGNCVTQENPPKKQSMDTINVSNLWHHRKKVFTPLHLNLHAGFPCNTFSHMSAVSAVWSHHLSLSCYLWHVRHTELLFRCPFVQLLMADMRMPAASCVLLFFHSEGRSCCWSEASRAGGKWRAISTTAPLDIDFRRHSSPWNISPTRSPLQPYQTLPEDHPQPS